MGEPLDFVHEGRLLRLCCKGCVKDFNKDPKKYLDKLDQMIIEKQKPTYPLDVCVVSDDKLGGEMGEPIDYVYQNRLVRFCCKSCIKDFKKDPEKYMAKIGQPAKKEGKKPDDSNKGHGHGGHDH